LIEAFTGLLSAAVVWSFGSGMTGLAVLAFTYFLVAMTFIDFDTKMLPDDLTLPLMWAGLLFNLNGGFVPLRDAVIGAAAGYMVLWTVNTLYRLVRGHDGMGYGDFKLLAALGAWMGWAKLPVIILLSSVVGSVVGLSLILFFRHAKDKQIPFGPYLAGAGMLAMMYAPQLASFTRDFGF
jgi:leader peptidase (prepilin peptidase)/N-methyltransferase